VLTKEQEARLTPEQRKLVEKLLAPGPRELAAKAKKAEEAKVIVLSTKELSADTMRERATRAAREAAERERAEIEQRRRKRDIYEAAYWHAVESEWHDQRATEYRGFHSRND
jgi:hypothetical protein